MLQCTRCERAIEAEPDLSVVLCRFCGTRLEVEAFPALSRTGGRRQDAAQLLGWGRNTLTRKIKELRLQ